MGSARRGSPSATIGAREARSRLPRAADFAARGEELDALAGAGLPLVSRLGATRARIHLRRGDDARHHRAASIILKSTRMPNLPRDGRHSNGLVERASAGGRG